MIVEERTYTLQAGKTSSYLAEYAKRGMEPQREHLGDLIGYFTTEIGTLNQVVHLWGYRDLGDRQERRQRLYADARWQEYVPTIRQWVVQQENRILVPASFSPVGNGR